MRLARLPRSCRTCRISAASAARLSDVNVTNEIKPKGKLEELKHEIEDALSRK
ncbi:hypothetical protein K788_0000225 [Paraburkholderia caribensis MBA4]|uniref:Uncharacterized protein n=1 Tax=Paraburkholderia caribensis MBA4 TaxID=1323664 RepID=A0A0P0RJB7_9BURK|nr:hypothetical protein K788_0000225 [Paraburkholderia caribensis MBA4]CAG9210805.1 conserved hypothetical protein [Paraburkholderia caribensis]